MYLWAYYIVVPQGSLITLVLLSPTRLIGGLFGDLFLRVWYDWGSLTMNNSINVYQAPTIYAEMTWAIH